MDTLFTIENLVALVALSSLEIVLGIDNIVFIAILCGRLPPERREGVRRMGLLLAMVARIGLLFGIGWIMRLQAGILPVDIGPFEHTFSGKDFVLLAGGLFLVAKATVEIHHKLEGAEEQGKGKVRGAGARSIILQIVALDLVFSIDSVVTAIAMAKHLAVMVTAVVIAVGIMLLFSGRIADFIERRPTLKMLALSFLLMIGVTLVAESCGAHIPKGYVYVAMAFSLGVELLNLRMRGRAEPVHLKDSHLPRA